MWRSARNAILGALLVGLFVGLFIGAFFGLSEGLSIGLGFGLMAGLHYGGAACIQHVILRFMLNKNGDIPWDSIRFLDYCAERIFLRKVGGGYIFVHRLLMEYFAGLENV